MSRALAIVLLGLMGFASFAQAAQISIKNNTPCQIQNAYANYYSFACSNDSGISITPGNSFTNGIGSCDVTQIGGEMKCGNDAAIPCGSYGVNKNPANYQFTMTVSNGVKSCSASPA